MFSLDKRYGFFTLLAFVVTTPCFAGERKGTQKKQSSTFTQVLIEQAMLSNSLFFFQRNRDRYDGGEGNYISVRDNFDRFDDYLKKGDYVSDLDHSTVQFGIDYQTGFWSQRFGYHFAGYGATDLEYSNNAVRNIEHEFSFAGDRWGEESKDKADSDAAVTKNYFIIKDLDNKLHVQLGYSPLSVPGVIGVNWSNHPGTYRGVQLNYQFEKLKVYSAWADEYKAPWYRYTQKFYKVNSWDPLTSAQEIDYIAGVGADYQIDSKNLIQASVGQSDDYLRSYFFKYELQIPWLEESKIGYLFYGSESINDKSEKLYQGFAWQQGLRASFKNNNAELRLEFLVNKAEGFGNYIPRLTRGYANSQGANEFWWDSRSDWNHDGEKAVFMGFWLDPHEIIGMKGWRIGTSFAYGWDAKRWADNQLDKTADKGSENAVNFDLGYTFQAGSLKGISLNLHYTDYNNHQDELGSWYYPNMFASEHDLKFSVNVPFQIF